MRIALPIALSALVLVSTATPAAAQSAQDTARARSLFSEGVELAASAEFEEAASRFRAAYAIRPAPAIAYNLAAALVELDELLEASELVRQVKSSDESDEDLRERADLVQVLIDERLSRLTVTVEGNIGDVTLAVDGHALSSGELGIPIPMDPGSHAVVVARDGAELERRHAELARGESGWVAFDALAWVVAPEPAPPPPPPPPPGPSFYETWWFWTIVGVVVVTGVTIAVIAAASGDADAYMGNFNPAVLTF